VREGEDVLVCFTAFADEVAYHRHLDALAHEPRSNELLTPTRKPHTQERDVEASTDRTLAMHSL
jgi:hypothetical protein